MQRPTTSGSRQAPDPYDQFLEDHNLYRKHTARDSSCLFRVIAEQMYDTQMLHSEIRQECVQYMTQHRTIFEQYVDRDFDDYLLNLSKPKTLGTLLELRALSYMYKRNVLLYQPYDLGNFFVFHRDYEGEFRVFYTFDYHFDSVYITDFIQEAAKCQSICYDLLYRMYFKIPDVDYAVEKMLHPSTFQWDTLKATFDSNGYMVRVVSEDGREFKLDLPTKTDCILENYKQCNFHCQAIPIANFIKFNIDPSKLENKNGYEGVGDVNDSLLPNKLISCVRQLLDDEITPFPYKVAKSLDPNMYRNIEFDCWNETRKEERRFSIYKGDNNYKVGAKCNVKLPFSEQELFTCHIQEMPKDKHYCVVYVEKLGEKHVVPYEALSPLPVGEFKPWGLPVRLQRQLQKFNYPRFASKLRPTWKKTKCILYNSAEKLNIDSSKNGIGNYNIQPFVKLENFNAPPLEYYTYPVSLGRPIMPTINGGDPCSIGTEDVFEGNATNAVYGPEQPLPSNIKTAVSEEPPILQQEISLECSDNAAMPAQMPQIVGNMDPSIVVPNSIFNAGLYPGFEYAPPVYPPNMPIFFTEGYPPSHQLVQTDCGTCFYVPSGYPQGFNSGMPIVHTSPLPPYPVYPPGTTLLPISFFVPPPPGIMPQILPVIDTPVLGDEANSYNDGNESIGKNVGSHCIKTSNDQPIQSSVNGESQQYNYSLMPMPMPMPIPPSAVLDQIRFEAPAIQMQPPMPVCDKDYYAVATRGKNEFTQESDKIFGNESNGPLNTNANAYHSMKVNGQDLPTDISTLRYFYNLGVDQHQRMAPPPCIVQSQPNMLRMEVQRNTSSPTNSFNDFPARHYQDGLFEIDHRPKALNNGVVCNNAHSASNNQHPFKRAHFTAVPSIQRNQTPFLEASNNGAFANDRVLNTYGGHPGMSGSRSTSELTFYETVPGPLIDEGCERFTVNDCNEGAKKI